MSNFYKSIINGKIPKDWKLVSIGEIADVTTGGTPSTKNNEYWGGDIPWMNSGEINLRKIKAVEGRITELGLNNSSTKIIDKHSVLMALAGQGKTRGKVAINELPLCTNQSLATIYNFKTANYEFVFQNLESRYSEIRKMSTGDGGRGGLNLKIIKSIKIGLPPLHEQQKIADILSTVDAKIAIIEQQITEIQELKKGLMQQLLTKGIGHTEMKESPLGVIPKGWNLLSLSSLLNKEKNITYGIVQPGEYVEDGIYLIRSQDYTKGRWQPISSIMKVTKEIDIPYQRSRVQEGDILITVVGANVGRIAIVPRELNEANISRSVARISIDKDRAESIFVRYYLESNGIKTLIRLNKVGGAQPVLNLKELSKLKIPLPSKNEQLHIVKILVVTDKKLDLLAEKKTTYQELKKGLMQQMLTGKVRVKV